MSTGRLLGVISLLLPCLAFAGSPATEPAPSIAKQISDVANREVPVVILRGHPQQYSRLADLMRAHHVLGISVAVIRGGAIEWSRGFGDTRIGGTAGHSGYPV